MKSRKHSAPLTINNVLPKFIKVKRWHYFHVFADNIDYHFDIEKMGEKVAKAAAKAKVLELITLGQIRIRIYEIDEQEDHRDDSILEMNEKCIYQLGEYPM